MGLWPVRGLLFGGDSGRARSGALPVPERDDTKVGAKERSPARHRETCGGKDEAGKIHSLSGTFWGGAMRPDTIGGRMRILLFYFEVGKRQEGWRRLWFRRSSGNCLLDYIAKWRTR